MIKKQMDGWILLAHFCAASKQRIQAKCLEREQNLPLCVCVCVSWGAGAGCILW